MKSILTRLTYACILSLVALVLPGCSQEAKDKEIKADITLKAKEDVNFAGVMFSVEKGVVTLSGICPTEKSRQTVKQKLGTIHTIDSLEDHLTISPLTLGSSLTMKQEVDSVLAQYPAVTASVSDTAVVLMGKIKSAELNKLMPSLKKLSPNVNNGQLRMEM